jgi:hypothetical protein
MLRELDLSKSRAVGAGVLPLLDRYPGLWRLRLNGCEGLTGGVTLGGFAELRQLRLAWNPRMTRVSLSWLPELRTLSTAMSEQFRILHLTDAPQVREVLLRGSLYLTGDDLVPLAGLPMLESLDLTGCVRVHGSGLASLHGLPRLRELILNGCIGLERVRLANLPALRVLDLAETRITHLDLAGVPALEQIDLHNHQLGPRTRTLEASLPPGCRVRD